MNKALTAVQWMNQQLLNFNKSDATWSEIYSQALFMEKEQIEEAFELGQLNENSYQHTGKRIYNNKEEYYKKSYES
jgi:hypothetical protein